MEIHLDLQNVVRNDGRLGVVVRPAASGVVDGQRVAMGACCAGGVAAWRDVVGIVANSQVPISSRVTQFPPIPLSPSYIAD